MSAIVLLPPSTRFDSGQDTNGRSFDQGHVDRAAAPHGDVLRGGRAAVAAADDNDPAAGPRPIVAQPPSAARREVAPAAFRKSRRCVVIAASSFCRRGLRREPRRGELDLLVGVTLGELRHDRSRALAALEFLHLAGRFRPAGRRRATARRRRSRRWCHDSWSSLRRRCGRASGRDFARLRMRSQAGVAAATMRTRRHELRSLRAVPMIGAAGGRLHRESGVKRGVEGGQLGCVSAVAFASRGVAAFSQQVALARRSGLRRFPRLRRNRFPHPRNQWSPGDSADDHDSINKNKYLGSSLCFRRPCPAQDHAAPQRP